MIDRGGDRGGEAEWIRMGAWRKRAVLIEGQGVSCLIC